MARRSFLYKKQNQFDTQPIGRAFSPLHFFLASIPRASPWAGIGRAFGPEKQEQRQTNPLLWSCFQLRQMMPVMSGHRFYDGPQRHLTAFRMMRRRTLLFLAQRAQ